MYGYDKENVDFDKSLKHGRDHMNTPGGFICAVDIARTEEAVSVRYR